MEQVIVTDVNAEDVEILWPKIKGHLDSALDKGQGEYSLNDIYENLLLDKMRLWILYNHEGRLLSSAVCEIQEFPQKRICYVVLVGGESMDYWPYAMTAIESWAAENNADAIVALTRRGIAKIMSNEGFNEVYTVIQKELSERRLH